MRALVKLVPNIQSDTVGLEQDSLGVLGPHELAPDCTLGSEDNNVVA